MPKLMCSPDSMPVPILCDPPAFREWLIRSGVMGIAQLLNFSLLFVTYYDKSLRNRCNLLIAFEAAFGALYQTNGFLTLAIGLLTDEGTINMRTCCLLVQPIPTLAAWAFMTMMLVIALDRLASIIFPLWYHRLSKTNSPTYFLLTFGICFLACAYHFQGKFRWVMEDAQKDKRVVCQLYDCNGGYVVQMSYSQILVTNACIVVAYICLWVVLRIKKGDSSESKLNIRDTRKLFKSLAILVIFYTLGHIIPAILRLIIPSYIPLKPDNFRLFVFLTTLPGNIAHLANVPVLILFSSAYRKAYKKLLPSRLNNSQIVPILIN